MATAQAVWGIDLGRCALKAIKLRAVDGGVEIVAHDFIQHDKILTQPDADRHELIRAALEKFLSRNDVSKDAVVVSVPGQHTLARFTKLPPVAPKRIPDIVRYEADQQIPFDMDEVIWDFQTFQQEGSPDLEVGIFAMKKELIREHLLHFEQVSIEPTAVQAGPLADYNAAHFDGLIGDETTILLDVGAENTDLVIATKDTFWTRTLPIGGNNFTDALVKSFKLSFSKAENLKYTAESSKYARQIFQAMRPIFADLVQELQRSIGFYSSTHRDTRVEKVVCFGNAFKLPGLQKYLQQNLGLPVERPESFQKATLAPGVGDGEFKEQFPSFGVAYGLAVQGLDLAQVNSNLLPVEIAKQLVWRKKRTTFAAAAACLLVAGGVVWFRQTTDMRVLAAGAGDRAQPPVGRLEAWQVIEDGPSPALSDRAQAQLIYDAGKVLKDEYQALGGQDEGRRAETEEIIALQASKAIVPGIFQVIHESVPVPEGSLGQVTSQAELIELIQRGEVPPRGKRRQLFIERLHMHFYPNVNGYEEDWSSIIPVPEPINPPDAALPAFKIELICLVPNEDGARFVSESFLEALRRNGHRPGTGFYFDRVHLVFGEKVLAESEAGRSGGARAGGGRGFGALSPGAQPGAENVDPDSLDPVTLEPKGGDWRFDIWIDVIPEDYPFEEDEEEEYGDEEEEGEGG